VRDRKKITNGACSLALEALFERLVKELPAAAQALPRHHWMFGDRDAVMRALQMGNFGPTTKNMDMPRFHMDMDLDKLDVRFPPHT
jgi:hypothetical protein